MDTSLPATTTAQEDLTVAGQRRINIIWEVTQAVIAVIITVSNVYCEVSRIVSPTLSNGFFLIVGFYFARTNHAAIGGVGYKPLEVYKGR